MGEVTCSFVKCWLVLHLLRPREGRSMFVVLASGHVTVGIALSELVDSIEIDGKFSVS